MISHKLLANRNKENVNPENKIFSKESKPIGVAQTKKALPQSFNFKKV